MLSRETAQVFADTDTSAIDSGLLWLVNADSPLSADFTPSQLATYQGVQLHPAALSAFREMLAGMDSVGITGLYLLSGYRSYDYQHALFSRKINTLIGEGHNRATAEVLAAQTVQRPGQSEHQLGLALDVTISGQLTEDFAKTDAGRWLQAYSHQYGFIVRYPQGKTHITQIVYEPWHLRYVGRPHASFMAERAFTLEEYMAYLSENPMIIIWGEEQSYYLVMLMDEYPAAIVMPADAVDISTNRPGEGMRYIITFRRMRGDL